MHAILIARLTILSDNAYQMEGNKAYSDRLEQALERQRIHLDQIQLPKLKERFETYYGTFRNFYNVLLRKSMIKEDPYKGEQKISEIEIPPDTEVSEMERGDQIGLRLSMYDSQLNFMLAYYHFSVEYLSLKRIRLLVDLTKFINWSNMSSKSGLVNTRLLGDLVSKIRGGSDTFSIQVLNNAQSQLTAIGNEIVNGLKDLSQFHREWYKLEVRKSVIELMEISPEMARSNPNAIADLIKNRFSSSLPGMPFYGELVAEILKEDYGPDSQSRQQAVLNRLSVASEEKTKKQEFDYRGFLLEALRVLSVAGKPIERALVKLVESSTIVEERRKKLDNPLRRWLYRVLGLKKETRMYEVEIVDPATSVAKRITIDFTEFCKKATQTGRVIASYGSKLSAGYARLETLDEDALYALLEQNIIEIQNFVRILPALSTYFQQEIDHGKRGKLRGIKLEINAVQNALVKSNQRRHEYVSRKEEQEQLRKLGIK